MLISNSKKEIYALSSPPKIILLQDNIIKMFTTGRIVFALVFVVVFVIVMVISYRKDKVINDIHYPKTSKIVLGVLLILLLLYLIVKARKFL